MKILTPEGIAPTIRPNSPGHAAGRLVHRRVLSALEGGPKSLDVDYNNYKAGEGGNKPYAYDKDEFCYTAQGVMESVNRGVAAVSRPGTFMWRRAGAVTDELAVKSDAVTICAFGPARLDEWSHRLSPEQIGPWDGRPETQIIPKRKHYSEVAPTPYPPAPDVPGIVYRSIFSEAQDGSRYMDVSHLTLAAGTTFGPVGGTRDEIWWLESGELTIVSETGDQVLKAGDFLFRPSGDVIRGVTVVSDATAISYAAPAA